MSGADRSRSSGRGRGHHVWYAAYGSNLDPAMLRRYLPDLDPDGESEWFRTTHHLYFAGRSRRWDGSVAFLSLTPGPSADTWCRAYRMRLSELGLLFAGENLVGDLPTDAVVGLNPGDLRRIPLPPTDDDRQGKYDTVLRLEGPVDEPVLTFTTSRELPRLDPDPAYLDVLGAALAPVLTAVEARAYLGRAAGRTGTD